MNAFAAPHFQTPEAARTAFEAILWPNGPVCHRCSETKRIYATKRAGRYRCGNPDCRKDFTVTTGTVMERSHARPSSRRQLIRRRQLPLHHIHPCAHLHPVA